MATEYSRNAMSGNSLSPGNLFEESFSSVGPIYTGLLMLAIPGLVVSVVTAILGPAAGIINFLFAFIVAPILTGAGIYYAHYYLSRQQNDLGKAFDFAAGKWISLVLTQLLLVVILIPCFVALIIPGIYVSVRLSQAVFGVIIANKSPVEAIQYSWDLTKNRWWSIFWALLAFGILVGIFFVLVGIGVGTVSSSALVTNLVSGIIGTIVSPVLSMYAVLLHSKLQMQGQTI